jgi:DNA-directed RNA polymerase specialized sigma24 family protein
VVLFCLVRLRAGQWSALREARVLPLVQAIVARRGVDLVRQHDRRSKRERIYINALACAESAWMSPDLVLQELELEALVSKTLDSLGPAYRRAFEIVRNEELTYEETARRLGLSPSTVSCYMTRALRRFRAMLIRDGIEPPLPLCTTPKCNDGERDR